MTYELIQTLLTYSVEAIALVGLIGLPVHYIILHAVKEVESWGWDFPPVEAVENSPSPELDIIALNGITGDCLTTADLEEEVAEPLHPHEAELNGQPYEWASPFTSPIACLLEDCPESSLTGQSYELFCQLPELLSVELPTNEASTASTSEFSRLRRRFHVSRFSLIL